MEGLPREIELYIFVLAAHRHSMARTLVQLNKAYNANEQLKMFAAREAKVDVTLKAHTYLQNIISDEHIRCVRLVRNNTTMMTIQRDICNNFVSIGRKDAPLIRQDLWYNKPLRFIWDQNVNHPVPCLTIYEIGGVQLESISFTRVVLDNIHSRIVFIEEASVKRAREAEDELCEHYSYLPFCARCRVKRIK